jgi:carboxypeptidase D
VHGANLHKGSVVVNYPYDDDGIPTGQYAASPDDDLFIDVSLRYSVHNPPMYASSAFPLGITNGCDWYRIDGGMQDWNYRYMGANEVTLELASPKRPSQALLPTYWAQNEESLLSYLESTHIGIRGVVINAMTGQPVYASITVQGNAQRVYTDPEVGDYHRMLLPGVYTLEIDAPGYVPETIGAISVSAGTATRMDVWLTPIMDLPIRRALVWTLALTLALAAVLLFEYKPCQNRLR